MGKNKLESRGYEFLVKEGPFKGLDDYLEAPEINVLNKHLNYPLQLSAFPEFDPNYRIRVKSGYFYEVLSQGIYGGKIKDRKELKNRESNDSLVSEPDVSDKKYFREIKSIRAQGDLQLTDSQIAKYSLLETGDYQDRKKINFTVFRHGIKNIQKKFSGKDLSSLLEDLSKSTRFMISLPFRTIFDLYISKNSPRYDGMFYSTMTRIYSRVLSDLLVCPEETLSKFNVDLRGLEFIKMKFPEEVYINGFEITPFPVLIVKDSTNKKWKKKFKSFMEDRSKHPFNFNLTIRSFLEGSLFSSKEENGSPQDDDDDEKVPF